MVYLTCLLITAWIFIIATSQGVFALVYARLLLRAKRDVVNSDEKSVYHPKAAVILAVRGSDPFLVANLSALLDQDYPEFKLFIVVDSEQDEAWPDVKRLQSLAPERVVPMLLTNHLSTCSLKCSAISEAVERIDPSFEVLAFLDGDAPPHRTWLRDLVEPLCDSSIGVTTGNRWYIPSTISWGAMVRYFWNAGAIVQVWFNGMIWAGSMALRREVIDRTDLVAAWRQSLSDDEAVVRQIRIASLRPQFVPSVIMPNREDISVSSFTPWSMRQLVSARSSEAGWAMVLFHAFSIATCVFAPLAMVAAGCALEDQRIVLLGSVSLGAYWGVAILSTIFIEFGMQAVLARNGVNAKWFNMWAGLYYFPAIVLSHLVYFTALTGATFCKKVSWRGIEYELYGNNRVRLVEYKPYKAPSGRENAKSIV